MCSNYHFMEKCLEERIHSLEQESRKWWNYKEDKEAPAEKAKKPASPSPTSPARDREPTIYCQS